MMSQIEREFEEFDRQKQWPMVYMKIKNESSVRSIEEQHSVGEARKPENRSKNRYRDVSPYDHSRVVLKGGESDYINASQIMVSESGRKYILSQGPLAHTASQFWQMVWEQKTKGIIMLNRVIEKGALKCFQYWPLGEDEEDEELLFKDTGLKVSLLEEQDYDHFIVRNIDVENLETGETREVIHFQYVTWPDFGVPSSPVSFLNFLNLVREHRVLEADVGPAIIHCSAGIGRSGTFCLVDSALILVEKTGTLNGLDLRSLLISMRSFRMGLIQTPDQLRFSYLAVIEGAKAYVKSDSHQAVNDVLEEYMDMTGGQSKDDTPPPPPQRTSSLSPSKGKTPPPPPRKHHVEDSPEQGEQPPSKVSKTDTNETPPKPPPPPPRKHHVEDSPEQGEQPPSKVSKNDTNETPPKPPRVGSSENPQVTEAGAAQSGGSRDSVETNKTEKYSENNNPVSNKLEGTNENQAENTDGGNEETGSPESSHTAEDHSQDGQGETELRQRRREERKKKTQEMIAQMKEKQRQSETWKKRKSYFKPIAIGISILLGTYLLYKFYW